MKNDNQKIVRKLADAYYKKNRIKNRILICTIALAVFLIYSVFAVITGKMDTDYLLYARNGGEITSTCLENASKDQYENIKKLDYIKELGIKKYVGYAKVNQTDEGIVEYLDKTGFEKLIMPAYADIHGKYPEKSNEIMLPVRWLKEYGIDNPKLGMEIVMQIQGKGLSAYENKEMILSGYYTDYVDPGINAPIAYVSREYLDEQKISIFPIDEVMLLQDNSFDAFSIEEQLYQDIEMVNAQQQFIGKNTLVRQSMEDLFGSYLVMACCMLIVMISAFLLIYNVVNISIRREIRQYGLLKTIGCSLKQLKKVINLQTQKIIFWGVILGGILGVGSVGILLRGTLEKLFLKGKGEADIIRAFYWEYLVFAIVVVTLITVLASNFAVKKIVQLSAIDSMKYSENHSRTSKKSAHSTNGGTIQWMAWRNVKRTPVKFMISILSLFIGYTAALGAVVITVGTDTTNDILNNPDFKISSTIEMHMISEYIPKEYTDKTEVIPKKVIDQIKAIEGIERVNLSKGGFAVIHPQDDKALIPKMIAGGATDVEEDFATLQIVDDEYIAELENYAQKNEIQTDIQALKNGEGVILLHHHELSSILQQEAEKVQESNISFYTLDSYGKKDKGKTKLGEMKCAGYVDLKEKHFPDLQMTTNGTNITYFIISQKGFEKLGMDEKYFAISLNVNPVKEPMIKQNIEKIVQNTNKKTQEWNQLLLYSNSDLLESAQNYIKATNLLLGTLGIILLFIGIMNYWNTIVTGIQVRKHELVMMESIGMTGKQLRTLLICEGIWYWSFTLLSVSTVGYVMLWQIGKSIKEELAYFKFHYPWELFIVLAIVLLLITILIAESIYYKTNKGSVAERLRQDTE